MYLKCSIQIEAEISNMCLYSLETSQGSDCSAQPSKHTVSSRGSLFVQETRKLIKQTQKATAALSWNAVAGLFKAH